MNDEIALVLGWWNTSLSPKGITRDNSEAYQIAAAVVNSLVNETFIDCLALGEVTNADLKNLLRDCASSQYGIVDGTFPAGHSRFDIGIIYNKNRLDMEASVPIISHYSNRTLKIAQRVEFTIKETTESLYVFVSHWPSRIRGAQDNLRNQLGTELRRSIESIIESCDFPQHIILLGDYNDEPFDQSLSQNLLASRDRSLIKKRKTLFYNPFWRLLGESKPHQANEETEGFAGTCFYKNGIETRWHTFDQILFSSSFLCSDRWYLNEQGVVIWRYPPLNDIIAKPDSKFDHFPVLSVIQRKI